jgi:predicted adenylyl cyclase CyaB
VSEFERETEIKFVADKDILNKISSIKLTPYEEVDEYFTTKEMLKNFTFLRLRKKHGKIVLQFKDILTDAEKSKDCYEADELNLELNEEQYEKIKKILSSTFPHNFIVKKIRSKGRLNDCEICLDDVQYLGLFLEIEGPREKILEICKDLGLDMEKRDNKRGYAIMTAKKMGLI